MYADMLTPAGGGSSRETQLGRTIRDARVDNRLSLRELAKRLGISPTHLSDVENDRRVPSEALLKALAGNLGLDFDQLMVMIGRVYSVTEEYVRQVPEAVSLFRKVSERRLTADELKALERQAERLARNRGKQR